MGKETGNQEVGLYAKHARQVMNLERSNNRYNRSKIPRGGSTAELGIASVFMLLRLPLCL